MEAAAVDIPRLPAPPAIDGRIDDETWQEAALLDGFVQSYPEPGAPAGLATAVRLG